jgi:hypothetical protein
MELHSLSPKTLNVARADPSVTVEVVRGQSSREDGLLHEVGPQQAWSHRRGGSAVWDDHVSDGFESRGALNISQNSTVL